MQSKAKFTKPTQKRVRTRVLSSAEFEAKLNEDATAFAQLIYDLYKQQQSV